MAQRQIRVDPPPLALALAIVHLRAHVPVDTTLPFVFEQRTLPIYTWG